MKQLDRIGKFLKSLEDNGIITAEKQSVVFSPDFRMLGGDNTGECTNDSEACNGTNNNCTNENLHCSTATNQTTCYPQSSNAQIGCM